MAYDIIGDIHGHAEPLKALLARLGYSAKDGTWRHSERTAIYVGDFIDRGPDQLEVYRIVRRMTEAGSGLAVMGNHEYNAIGFATRDPNNPDVYLRKRSDKNVAQHASFLEQVGDNSELHHEVVAWFKTLPLWLELPGVRVVHACWNPEHMARLAPLIDSDNRLIDSHLIEALRPGTVVYEALDVVLKGLEVALPAGRTFKDKEGVERSKARIRWWDEAAITYDVAAIVDEETAKQLPSTPLPAGARLRYDDRAVCFVGHYWLSGRPQLTSTRVACVDFSIAKGGVLASYSWDGEPALDGGKLTWV